MPVKLNHYYTINQTKKKEYDKFIIKKFIPKINKLGMHAVAGWSELVGAYSEIILESVSNDLDLLEKAMRDPILYARPGTVPVCGDPECT